MGQYWFLFFQFFVVCLRIEFSANIMEENQNESTWPSSSSQDEDVLEFETHLQMQQGESSAIHLTKSSRDQFPLGDVFKQTHKHDKNANDGSERNEFGKSVHHGDMVDVDIGKNHGDGRYDDNDDENDVTDDEDAYISSDFGSINVDSTESASDDSSGKNNRDHDMRSVSSQKDKSTSLDKKRMEKRPFSLQEAAMFAYLRKISFSSKYSEAITM